MTKSEYREIEKVVRHLQMENCDFATIGPNAGNGLPQTEREVTLFIRERTRLWRNSWCIAPLEAIVEKYSRKWS